MHSFSWRNGQWQNVLPSSQSSQADSQHTHSPMWNMQPGMADNSCQQKTLNHGMRIPQRSNFNIRNGVYANRQWSNWQTSAVPHQTVSSQQPAGGERNGLKMLLGNVQNSFIRKQNANHLVVNGPQAATQPDFHMNSGNINQLSHIQPIKIIANTIDTHQDRSTQWNQRCTELGKQSAWTRPMSDPEKYTNSFLQNVNAEPIKPISACTTTATSLPHEQAVGTSNSLSIIAHNRQSALNQYYKQHRPKDGFIPLINPPSYEMAVSQPLRHHSTKNLSSNEQSLPLFTISRETQQHAINLNSIQNNGQEASHRCVSKTNELVDPQEQKYRRQMIERIADDLRNSFPATSDGCLPENNSSPYRANQFLSAVRMTDPNQSNHSSKFTVTESCNMSLLLNSGPSLPKTTHSVMSRTQDSLNTLQPNPVRSGGEFQSMKWPENSSLQTSKTKSSVENWHQMPEKLQMLSTVMENDNAILSSPGHTGTRAVAVVQPLSQEANHAAIYHVSSEIFNQSADKNVIHSAASSHGTAVSSSDSAGHEDKQLCAEDTGSELSIDMQVDQRGAPTTLQSVAPEVPANQSGESQTDSRVLELSLVPTVPWTTNTLAKLIQDEDKAQIKLSRNVTMSNTSTRLIDMFWGGNLKNLEASFKSLWCDYVKIHREFRSKNVTPDSIVLSQVKGGYESQLQSFHILKDNEVYLEPPYKSSWLNVNEQLDDIDKEFGFPLSLKHLTHMSESDNQPDLDCTVNSITAPTVRYVANNVPSQSALEPVDSGEEHLPNSTVEDTPPQVVSPNEARTIDSTDQHYSFEIKVLSPEEARVIFEKIQSKTEQGQHVECGLNVSELEKESDIEEVCCISRWVEINLGSDGLSLSPCHCEDKQDLTNCTDNRDKEEMAGQKEDDLTSISKSHVEGENQAKGGEVIKNQIMIYSSMSELCDDLRQTDFLTENGHKCHTHSDKEPKDQLSLNYNQLSILHTNKTEDKGLSSSNTENQFTGATQSCASISSDKDVGIMPRSESEVARHTSELEENCGQAHSEEQQLQITAAFSLNGNHETVERKRKSLSSHDRGCPVQSCKRKPPFDMDSLPSTFQKVTDKTENEPSASNVRTVQLVLFGSTPQDMCGVIGSRKRHTGNSSSAIVSGGLLRPPEVLYVNLSPLRRKPSESIAIGERSVKRRHRQWGRHIQLTKSRYSSMLKTQKWTFSSSSGMSLKRTGTVNPTNTENLPMAPKMKMQSLNGNAKCCLIQKKRVSLCPKKRVFHSVRLKQREQVMKQDGGILKQRADQERSCGGNESPSDLPLQENIVLRFSVLPNTFNFKDGCHERKEANDPDPNKPVLVKGKHKDSSKTVVKIKGKWLPSYPEKKYCAAVKTPVPKTAGLFQEFQKKHMAKQRSIDG